MTAAPDHRARAAAGSPDPARSGRLAGRIALITGASRGIGRAVAAAFAKEGAKLIVAARTQGALEDLDDELSEIHGGPLSLIAEDLNGENVIERIGAAIYERFGRLDILVANAGILGRLGPMPHQDPKTFARVLDTNIVQNWRLIRAMDPLLRASDAGRAMFVTDRAGREPVAYWGAYAVSKAALDMMVKTYAAELLKTRVKVNLIDPGPVATALRDEAFPGQKRDSQRMPHEVTADFVALAEAACPHHGALIATDPPG